jgi:membrane protease subunit HflK
MQQTQGATSNTPMQLPNSTTDIQNLRTQMNNTVGNSQVNSATDRLKGDRYSNGR